jgi:hypothetical protein
MVSLSSHECAALVDAVNDLVLTAESRLDDSDEFPRADWPEPIRKLEPLAVYSHGCNVVIVLSRDAHLERGFYVEPYISSRTPEPNDPIWSWTSMGDSGFLFAYNRKL